MHKDGITVAEYWTELPLKAELEQKLHAALLEARERLARRRVMLGGLGASDEPCRSPNAFDPASDKTKGMSMSISKGLGFPVVALPGAGQLPAKGEDEPETAWVFLCRGDKGYAAVGNWGGWGWGIWAEPVKYQMSAITSTWCFSAW